MLILDSKQIAQKIARMAHHIYEIHYKEKNIIIVGVRDRGFEVARRIADQLRSISELEVELYSISLDKDKPQNEVNFEGDVKNLKGNVVVLVDDVLNSGRTLIYAAKYLLDAYPRILATATLVDRIHRRFPIRADYVGLTLSTNLREHIAVELGKKDAVYLE